MIVSLCIVFLMSGAAALVFETLWFRQAGLALGNTVWASALVTASFMAGLALGNALVARWGWRTATPLRVYAALEAVVGVTGVALVLLFPSVGQALAPLMGSLGASTLNALRVAVSFALLLVPSCAMGATLPLLTAALSAHDPNFGRTLGRLYGWNTFGAVLGTLAGDLVLIEAIGIRGTALVAAGLNLAAAAGALYLASRAVGPVQRGEAPARVRLRAEAWRPLVAAFLAGGILLALEVVWFRLLLAFTPASAWTFAVMLAVVLLGIAAGGVAASAWLGRRPNAHEWAPLPALVAGVAVVASYGAPLSAVPASGDTLFTLRGYFELAFPLMFPACFLSGVLFPLLGRALHERLGEATRSTGLLTLANTTGAMIGALAAGFLVLPAAGVERSLFGLAGAYGVVGLLAVAGGVPFRQRVAHAVAAALLLVSLALFPFGLMQRQYVPRIVSRWKSESARPIGYEEGLSETVMILRQEAFGRPLMHRLVTNGIAMSGTNYVARRYMGMYVWWPVAVHPSPRRALLISYGLGTTARALVETRELERIDVVDTSAGVLRLSALAQESPTADPLASPRVHAHVEDGRFYLLTTPLRYDIITAEPPPPRTAGVASLYSREYFGLARSRLAEGGIVTYWLPVYQLRPRDMRTIVSAFCAAFDDCSLWSGFLTDWMLVGTRHAQGPVSAERFSAQWRDAVVAGRLHEAGLDEPALLGATFLADAPALRELVAGEPALDDDHPYRISPRVSPVDQEPFVPLMQIARPMQRFFESELIRRLWPESVREATRAAFLAQDAVNAAALGAHPPAGSGLADLDWLLTRTTLHAPVLWALGTSVAEVRLAQAAVTRGEGSTMAEEVLGMDALARRDYREAARRLGIAEPHAAHAARLRMWRVLSLCLGGDPAGSARLLASARGLPGDSNDPAPWRWLAERCASPEATPP